MNLTLPGKLTKRARRAPSWNWYVLAVLFIAIYVNAFEIWRWLVESYGKLAASVPVVATLIILTTFLLVAIRSAKGPNRIKWLIVVCAIGLATAGLITSNPLFPSKAIHVPQYMVIALLIRRGLCTHLSGWPLTLMGFLITIIFGCHDELVQGFHPQRFFGLADIVSDAWGAAAGVLLAHGFGWMESNQSNGPPPSRFIAVITLCVLLAFGFELTLLYENRGKNTAVWIAAPLLIGALVWICTDIATSYGSGWKHALRLIVSMLALATVYPAIAYLTEFKFN